jgi:predicted nucleic acid-binding protein
MYVLDSNVVSELRRPNRADPCVLDWAARTSVSRHYLSAVTVLEIELGILRVERRDHAQSAVLRDWLERQILPAFEDRILAFDTAVARRCAALHVPDPRPERDALIAATALAHGMTVVTRNVVDFAGTGVTLVNPWDAAK